MTAHYTNPRTLADAFDLHQRVVNEKHSMYQYHKTFTRKLRRSVPHMIHHGLGGAVILVDIYVGNWGTHSEVRLALPRSPKSPSRYIKWRQLPRSAALRWTHVIARSERLLT
jgi:hypothetical protein